MYFTLQYNKYYICYIKIYYLFLKLKFVFKENDERTLLNGFLWGTERWTERWTEKRTERWTERQSLRMTYTVSFIRAIILFLFFRTWKTIS